MAQHQHNIKAQSERAWLKGALAGFVATEPMTLFMLVTQSFLPKGQRYALPPEIITKELARRVHVRQHLNKGQVLAATLVSHFGYGAAMGTLHSALGKKRSLPSPSPRLVPPVELRAQVAGIHLRHMLIHQPHHLADQFLDMSCCRR